MYSKSLFHSISHLANGHEWIGCGWSHRSCYDESKLLGELMSLKYLFAATFADGHVVKQTQADVSLLCPPDAEGNGKSAFYDVLNYPGELTLFSLVDCDGYIKATVDLNAGLILANGEVVRSDDSSKRELIYWRLMTVSCGTNPECTGYQIGFKTALKDYVATVN
jgi:hypothetical protein